MLIHWQFFFEYDQRLRKLNKITFTKCTQPQSTMQASILYRELK
ncbi:MAG: hypothetical protein ACI8SE_001571 [Bacteroidia bacterium]|jgi:hypothetical protein